jgi:hypothetical protein
VTDPLAGAGPDPGVVAALLAEVQEHVKPMRISARPSGDGFSADLLRADGHVVVAMYSDGPDELTAVLSAEQRYLVEQGGAVRCVSGATYLDKARERIRRARQDRP